jgi:predicted HicB family RNase H-like nuclease
MSREVRYIVIFLVQFLLLAGFRVYHELISNPTDALTTFLDVIDGLAPVIVFVTASTVLIQEGGEMLAERYLRRRFEKGKEEERKRWMEWNKRRLEAEAEGKPFDEPPPGED